MNQEKKSSTGKYILQGSFVALLLFIVGGLVIFRPETGKTMGNHILKNGFVMLKMLPLTMILVSLFEEWIERERVERHLGNRGGAKSFLWAVLLGGTTIGPMIVALPVAATLYKKGARLSVIFTYIFASSVCRIPMTIFESSYLGIKFTLIRYGVAIPLIIGVSILFERLLRNSDFRIVE